MTQGIAAYKLSDTKYLVLISDEVWKIDADGWAELLDGPVLVKGERVDGLRLLPRPVLAVIAGRCEALNYELKFEVELSIRHKRENQ